VLGITMARVHLEFDPLGQGPVQGRTTSATTLLPVCVVLRRPPARGS
jgi:hypothetical protein